MSNIHTVPIEADGSDDEGDIIELPETVGRVDTFYDQRPSRGVNFEMTVVGRGDLQEYILLNTGGLNPSVEDGAQILANDVQKSELWYAVPLSQYGGDSE